MALTTELLLAQWKYDETALVAAKDFLKLFADKTILNEAQLTHLKYQLAHSGKSVVLASILHSLINSPDHAGTLSQLYSLLHSEKLLTEENIQFINTSITNDQLGHLHAAIKIIKNLVGYVTAEMLASLLTNNSRLQQLTNICVNFTEKKLIEHFLRNSPTTEQIDNLYKAIYITAGAPALLNDCIMSSLLHHSDYALDLALAYRSINDNAPSLLEKSHEILQANPENAAMIAEVLSIWVRAKLKAEPVDTDCDKLELVLINVLQQPGKHFHACAGLLLNLDQAGLLTVGVVASLLQHYQRLVFTSGKGLLDDFSASLSALGAIGEDGKNYWCNLLEGWRVKRWEGERIKYSERDLLVLIGVVFNLISVNAKAVSAVPASALLTGGMIDFLLSEAVDPISSAKAFVEIYTRSPKLLARHQAALLHKPESFLETFHYIRQMSEAGVLNGKLMSELDSEKLEDFYKAMRILLPAFNPQAQGKFPVITHSHQVDNIIAMGCLARLGLLNDENKQKLLAIQNHPNFSELLRSLQNFEQENPILLTQPIFELMCRYPAAASGLFSVVNFAASMKMDIAAFCFWFEDILKVLQEADLLSTENVMKIWTAMRGLDLHELAKHMVEPVKVADTIYGAWLGGLEELLDRMTSSLSQEKFDALVTNFNLYFATEWRCLIKDDELAIYDSSEESEGSDYSKIAREEAIESRVQPPVRLSECPVRLFSAAFFIELAEAVRELTADSIAVVGAYRQYLAKAWRHMKQAEIPSSGAAAVVPEEKFYQRSYGFWSLNEKVNTIKAKLIKSCEGYEEPLTFLLGHFASLDNKSGEDAFFLNILKRFDCFIEKVGGIVLFRLQRVLESLQSTEPSLLTPENVQHLLSLLNSSGFDAAPSSSIEPASHDVMDQLTLNKLMEMLCVLAERRLLQQDNFEALLNLHRQCLQTLAFNAHEVAIREEVTEERDEPPLALEQCPVEMLSAEFLTGLVDKLSGLQADQKQAVITYRACLAEAWYELKHATVLQEGTAASC